MIESKAYGEVLQIRMCRYPDFPPATWVCAYLVDGLLVDSGPAHTAQELTAFLKDKIVKKVVNTHFHEDHISANKLLQDAYGVEIFAHALAIDKINRPAELYPYQEEVWGYPVPSLVKPLADILETEKYRFEVIATPGHDLDHVCLFERSQGWLFTGDLYVTTRPTASRPMFDMPQILEDLKKIRALNPRIMFPAPTHVVLDPADKLDRTIDYLEDVGARVAELHSRGMDTEQIRQEIFGDEGIIAEMTQQQFSSLNIVKSFLEKYER
ncbi:MAG: MBL fold metallo-hydrolase [Dehalococcoidia bacterium]|jgi:glyoxylase-like metal-dependent hydrolase (beta-lactamase superfamily II)